MRQAADVAQLNAKIDLFQFNIEPHRLDIEQIIWLGQNFQTVMPYVVMVIVLLVRPYGLFGTKEVKRV